MRKKFTGLKVAGVVLLATIAATSVAFAVGSTDETIKVCHKTDGKPGGETIEISTSALQEHLNHGDRPCPCELSPQLDPIILTRPR